MARAPGPTPSTSGLLTTGLVGGWLCGCACLAALAVVAIAAASMQSQTSELGVLYGAGMLLPLVALVWVAGVICSTIGWYGLAAIFPVARLIGVLGILVLAGALMLPVIGAGLRPSGARAMIIAGLVLFAAYYAAQAGFWARFGVKRGAARLAVVGASMCVVCALATLVLVWSAPGVDGNAELVMLLVLVTPLSGALAHLGGGFAMAGERTTARALQSFD